VKNVIESGITAPFVLNSILCVVRFINTKGALYHD